MAEKKKKIVSKKKRTNEEVLQAAKDAVAESAFTTESATAEIPAGEEVEPKSWTEKETIHVEVSQPIPQVRQEIVIHVSSGTPTKDLAHSLIAIHEKHPDAYITAKYIGPAPGQQLTKGIIEANRMLIAHGKIFARFDFWTNFERGEDKRSVNNVRLEPVPVKLGTILSGLMGLDVKHVQITPKREG